MRGRNFDYRVNVLETVKGVRNDLYDLVLQNFELMLWVLAQY